MRVPVCEFMFRCVSICLGICDVVYIHDSLINYHNEEGGDFVCQMEKKCNYLEECAIHQKQ